MLASSTYLNSQQFLIEPLQRLRFVRQYVLMTGLSRLAVIFMFRNLPTSLLIWDEGGIQDAIIGGAVMGTVVGATQWLILRKYIPSWLWIVATAAGLLISTTISQGWQLIMQSLASGRLPHLLSSPLLEAALVLGFLVGILSSMSWLGLTQWLVLRQYVRSSWWWIFLPPLVLFPVGLLMLVGYYSTLLPHVGLRINWEILGVGTLATAQAIGLCCFRKKTNNSTHNFRSELESPLASAPEITDYWQIQALSKRLYTQINQVWQTNLTSSRCLIYLVGVAQDGLLVAYQPVNQVAIDCISQTPLPNLIGTSRLGGQEEFYQQPLARFQVVFKPPGSVEIHSLKGVPLLLIGIGTATVILLLSTYPTWF